MPRAISIALIAVGVVLLIWGYNSSEAFASEMSEALTGNPTDRTLWLVIGGVAAVVIGGVGLIRSRSS